MQLNQLKHHEGDLPKRSLPDHQERMTTKKQGRCRKIARKIVFQYVSVKLTISISKYLDGK